MKTVVVDTSLLIAVLLGEADYVRYLQALATYTVRKIRPRPSFRPGVTVAHAMIHVFPSS